MPLTDIKCKNTKSSEKPQKLSDSHGLYLEVMPSGSKYWRLKYRHLGKEKRLALGVYPEVSLGEAREKREQARKLLTSGIDPSVAKKEHKRQALINAENTFEIVAREWHQNQLNAWSEPHGRGVMRKLETDIFPYIGKRPLAEIDAPELLDVLRKIEKREALDMARRARQICGKVFRYGVATGRCQRDLTTDLKDALKVVKTTHFAALNIKEMPEFLQKLERNENRLYSRTRRAIKLLMLTFVRTSELINATWNEFDFEAKLWRIPAERMKMRNAHIVPLSRQVIEMLKEQKAETGHLNTDWVFPSHVRPKDPMSNGTILVALKRMGYSGRMTGHGFRALARTTLRETLNYDADVIERQLAHGHRDKVAAAYDRAQHLDKRKKMIQHWADYLAAVASDNKVIVGKFKKSV